MIITGGYSHLPPAYPVEPGKLIFQYRRCLPLAIKRIWVNGWVAYTRVILRDAVANRYYPQPKLSSEIRRMALKSARHIDSLDCLRGIAALGIVLLHVCERWDIHRYPNHLYLAVPFFFTLSGYVIARSYEARLRSGMTLLRFMGIRLVRLYPMLAVSLFIAACCRASWQEVVMGLLFVPSVTDESLFPANGPQWSLFLEVVGNVVHATYLRWLTDRLLLLIVLVSGIGMAWAALHFGKLEVGWGLSNLWGGVFVFVFSYGTGVLIHRFEQRGLLPALRVPLLLLILVYIVSAGIPQHRTGFLSASRDMLCAAIIFPTIIIFAIRSSLPRWLDGMAKLSGDISYPLYIVHHPMILALAPLVKSLGLSDLAVKSVGVATVFVSTLIAYLLFKGVDVPIRMRLNRMINARRQQPSAGPA